MADNYLNDPRFPLNTWTKELLAGKWDTVLSQAHRIRLFMRKKEYTIQQDQLANDPGINPDDLYTIQGIEDIRQVMEILHPNIEPEPDELQGWTRRLALDFLESVHQSNRIYNSNLYDTTAKLRSKLSQALGIFFDRREHQYLEDQLPEVINKLKLTTSIEKEDRDFSQWVADIAKDFFDKYTSMDIELSEPMSHLVAGGVLKSVNLDGIEASDIRFASFFRENSDKINRLFNPVFDETKTWQSDWNDDWIEPVNEPTQSLFMQSGEANKSYSVPDYQRIFNFKTTSKKVVAKYDKNHLIFKLADRIKNPKQSEIEDLEKEDELNRESFFLESRELQPMQPVQTFFIPSSPFLHPGVAKSVIVPFVRPIVYPIVTVVIGGATVAGASMWPAIICGAIVILATIVIIACLRAKEEEKKKATGICTFYLWSESGNDYSVLMADGATEDELLRGHLLELTAELVVKESLFGWAINSNNEVIGGFNLRSDEKLTDAQVFNLMNTMKTRMGLKTENGTEYRDLPDGDNEVNAFNEYETQNEDDEYTTQ